VRYSAADGAPTIVDSGAVDTSSTYKLSVLSKGSSETFKINGNQVFSGSDSTYLSCNGLSLIVDSNGNSGVSAEFSDFNYTVVGS
jgi:hypothetical protein